MTSCTRTHPQLCNAKFKIGILHHTLKYLSRPRTLDVDPSTKAVAEHTSILPKLVCAFQRPMMRPLLPLPYQLAMMATTEGHPLACTKPA